MTEQEQKLLEVAIEIRKRIADETEYSWGDELRLLNDALEPYGQPRIGHGPTWYRTKPIIP